MVLTYDMDFEYKDLEKYTKILQDLEKEGWEVYFPDIEGYKDNDMIGCYMTRKWK